MDFRVCTHNTPSFATIDRKFRLFGLLETGELIFKNIALNFHLPA